MHGITVIVPVYNEEEIIEENTKELMRFLVSLDVDFEIILASNGSDDGTLVKGHDLAKQNDSVEFFHISGKGVGNAFMKAVLMAKYDYIVSVDMDLSIDLDFIRRVLGLMDDFDIIIGSKQQGRQYRSFLRRIPSAVYIFLIRLLLGLKYHDYSMAAKVYRKDFVKDHLHVISRETSYVINLVYSAYREGYRIIEIPVRCTDSRRSRFNLVSEAIHMFWNLIILKFTKKYV